MFNFFVTFCCLVSSYIYAAIAALRFENSDGLMQFLIIFFEAVFFIDIMVNCVLSFEKEYNSQIIVEKKVTVISTNYASTTFYKDLIPIIPF